MKTFQKNTAKSLALSVSALALVVGAPALAQDAEEPAEEVVEEAEEEAVDITTGAVGATSDQGSITVTGSRIRKSTFNSISPLQVITTESTQDVGAFDPAQILQRSESASGTQFDATFNGFVLDNGPGSETLNLRGLGANRTLVLINGRRWAPAGVEGAPVNPSINLLPASLIDRYDLLLDGASSVYGSDAVAGVGNIILRKDFDGLELFVGGNVNEQGAGNDYTISGAWGFNTDRAFFGIGAEYRYRDEIRFGDRDFLAGCDRHLEVTDSGDILTTDLYSNATVQARTPGVQVREEECKVTSQVGRIVSPFQTYGSVYYTDGPGNSGIPNFNESTIGGVDIDADGDGFRDLDFQDVNRNGANQSQIFQNEQDLYNVMAYGEYTFPGSANITPFFEANYFRAEVRSDNNFAGQIFPFVPGSNPFNPCNIPNGTDCAAAEVTLLGRPGGNAGFSLPVIPVISVEGDRNNDDVTLEQYRAVVGVKGDLPFVGSSWTFEVAGVYTRSNGSNRTVGIREDKLALALGIDPTADYNSDGVADNNGDGVADDYNQNAAFPPTLAGGACDVASLANPGLAAPGLTDGCVPVNLFAPSLLGAEVGDFATQEERDYVFGERLFDTTYEQKMLSAFVTGDLFELPAGPVGAVFGVEWREDTLDSQPNDIAANGLFFAFSADQGAAGSKWIREAFGEISIPLQADKPWVRELSVDIAGRITEEEYYGTNGTYSIKGGWRPIDPLLLKVTYGTSFRAPNLRENFLRGQSGFNTYADPCAVPSAAYVNEMYDANLDTRDDAILSNCIREGRDPTAVGLDPTNAQLAPIALTGVEITTGGTLDLEPETSRSITAGFAFEETFGDGFDFSLNFNYYDVKLKQSIIEPSTRFIINDCFGRQDASRSPFCDRITAGPLDASTRGLITNIASGFINLNEESVRGIDINTQFGKEVSLFGKQVDLDLQVRANHLIERSNLFIGDDGAPSFDEDSGEFGFPKWTGTAVFRAQVDDFRFTWQTRYIGRTEQAEEFIDPFSDAFGYDADGNFTGFFSDTCLGGGSRDVNGVVDGRVAGDGVYCRDVGYAKEYFEHTASIRYDMDTWRFTFGVTNIFDKKPPQVDSNEVFSVANNPIGNGYDFDGREFFASVRKTF